VTIGFLLGTGWMSGIALAEGLMPGWTIAGGAALAFAPVAGGAAILLRPARYALAVAALLAGLARAELPAGDHTALARAGAFAGVEVVAEGLVADDPHEQAGGWSAVLEPSSIRSTAGGLPAVGSLQVTGRGSEPPAPGDSVRVRGRLRLPRESPGFDRRAQLARTGVALELAATSIDIVSTGSGFTALPWRLREVYRAAVLRLLPEPNASLLLGVVLGVRAPIPPRLRQQLIDTGLVHLLVLSGLKVAVFTRLAAALLRPLPPRYTTWPLLALVGLYALVGGATAAGVRAAAMGGLALLGSRLGRPAHVWTSLALVGAAMLAWRPDWAIDTGFLLSFLGTAAIVLLTPPIEHRLRLLPGPFREPFAVTCAAQVGTLPVGISGFQLVSPISPIANAAVLPLLPVLVASGFLIVPLATIPDLGRLLALPVAAMLTWLQQVAWLLGAVPGAVIPVRVLAPAAGLAYYVGFGGLLAAWSTAGRRRIAAFILAGAFPLLVAGGEFGSWMRSPPVADILDVGDGQAVLVTGPAGRILVDGGPSPARLAGELGQHLPPWGSRVDAVFVTASGAGHVGGLAGFDRDVTRVYIPGIPLPGSAWRSAAAAMTIRGAGLTQLAAGDAVHIAGVRIDVLAPEPGEDGSDESAPPAMGLQIRGPSGRALCDLSEMGSEAQVVAAARLRGGCDFVLLPAGGRSLPAPEFMAGAAPHQLVISAAAARPPAGFPVAGLRRTDQEGTIELPL
jgi:competence protein ComEC